MPAPANDSFANAQLLPSPWGAIDTFNGSGGTSDGPNDPLHSLFHSYGLNTVWYKWVGGPGVITIYTSRAVWGTGATGGPVGSGSVFLNRPVIGLYQGSALGALRELAFDAGTTTFKNYSNENSTAGLLYDLPAHDTYYIEITGLIDAGTPVSGQVFGAFRLFWDGPDITYDLVSLAGLRYPQRKHGARHTVYQPRL